MECYERFVIRSQKDDYSFPWSLRDLTVRPYGRLVSRHRTEDAARKAYERARRKAIRDEEQVWIYV